MTTIDPRFNERLVEQAWRLLAEHGYKASTHTADVSLAVHWFYMTTVAFEGKAEEV